MKDETDGAGNEISGGIFYSAVLQGNYITIQLPAELTPALAGIRDASRVFTGRDEYVGQLMRLLDPDTGEAAPRTSVITGLAGIGKTELARQAAHAALRNGWFPGGVLFHDLLGYDPEPRHRVEAGMVLESFLRAIQIPADHIPPGLQERSRLFASVMARYAELGRPVLVVLDNASSAAQVTPLVPAAGKVLVTSRHTLPLDNARIIPLGKLTSSAGVDLLAGELCVSGGIDTRVADQPDDALLIAQLCDGLPLALHIVGWLLAAHRTKPLSSMAADLDDERTRLDEMSYRGPDRDQRAVRSAFDLSYGQLEAEQARVFRLLPANPGPEVSTEAVAAMASLDARTTRGYLEELERAHLVETGTRYGRWRMHDLIHVYASGHLAESGDGVRAFLELLLYYVSAVGVAARLLDPAGTREAEDPFADQAQALSWLDIEYPNLTWFGDVDIKEPAVARTSTAILFLLLWRYLELRRRTDDWVRFTTHALRIAREVNDVGLQGEALTKLGNALRQARRFGKAIAACQEAADIQRGLHDRQAEGIALNNLAAAQAESALYDDARVSAESAAAIFRETGDLRREGIALGDLSGALMGMGRFAESIPVLEQVVGIFRATGDRHNEAITWLNLGVAMDRAGRPDEAIAAIREAVDIMLETDDQHGAGMALTRLAETLYRAERFAEATAVAQEAVTALRDLRDPQSEGSALAILGKALQETGHPDQAITALRDAATAFQLTRDRDREGRALNVLGCVLLGLHRLDEALLAFHSAAGLFRQTANRGKEGTALINLGTALWKARRSDEAIPPIQASIAAFHEGCCWADEASSLVLLSMVLGPGRIDEAIPAGRAAIQIFRATGDLDGERRALTVVQAWEKLKRILDAQHARLDAGEFNEVLLDYQRLADVLSQAGDKYGHAVMSVSLGTALLGAGRPDEAIAALEGALVIFGETGDKEREHAARTVLQAARRAQRDAAGPATESP